MLFTMKEKGEKRIRRIKQIIYNNHRFETLAAIAAMATQLKHFLD